MADHNLAAFYPSLENLFDDKGGLEAQDCRPSFYVGEDLIMKSECLRVSIIFLSVFTVFVYYNAVYTLKDLIIRIH